MTHNPSEPWLWQTTESAAPFPSELSKGASDVGLTKAGAHKLLFFMILKTSGSLFLLNYYQNIQIIAIAPPLW